MSKQCCHLSVFDSVWTVLMLPVGVFVLMSVCVRLFVRLCLCLRTVCVVMTVVVVLLLLLVVAGLRLYHRHATTT